MQKIIVFLFSFFITALAFADEALMLPEKVWRIYHVYTTSDIDKKYDVGGDKVSTAADLNYAAGLVANTLRGANPSWDYHPLVTPKTEVKRYDLVVEYGYKENVGFQVWLPFFLTADTTANANTDYGSMTNTLAGLGANYAALNNYLVSIGKNGKKAQTFGDLLVGAKWQFFKTGNSPNDNTPGVWRAAIAAGAYVPTGKVADPMKLETGTTTAGSESYIPGIRTYLDYQVTSDFYINWFTETQYRLKGETKKLDTSTYTAANGKYKPGTLEYTEFDFAYNPNFNDTWQLKSGFITFAKWVSRGEYSSFNTQAMNKKDDSQQYYGYKPYLGVFYKGQPMPVRGTLSYTAPYAGHNSSIQKLWQFKFEMFLKF